MLTRFNAILGVLFAVVLMALQLPSAPVLAACACVVLAAAAALTLWRRWALTRAAGQVT